LHSSREHFNPYFLNKWNIFYTTSYESHDASNSLMKIMKEMNSFFVEKSHKYHFLGFEIEEIQDQTFHATKLHKKSPGSDGVLKAFEAAHELINLGKERQSSYLIWQVSQV
jgi:hypothetical protein